jgi:hypothetical protein
MQLGSVVVDEAKFFLAVQSSVEMLSFSKRLTRFLRFEKGELWTGVCSADRP